MHRHIASVLSSIIHCGAEKELANDDCSNVTLTNTVLSTNNACILQINFTLYDVEVIQSSSSRNRHGFLDQMIIGVTNSSLL